MIDVETRARAGVCPYLFEIYFFVNYDNVIDSARVRAR